MIRFEVLEDRYGEFTVIYKASVDDKIWHRYQSHVADIKTAATIAAALEIAETKP